MKATSKIVTEHPRGWEVVIPLVPRPAARPRVSRYGAYYPKNYETWRRDAHELLKPFKDPNPYKGPVKVYLSVVCSRPKNPTNTFPRGDIDNYEKAAYDAITRSGAIWHDDVQITTVRATKRYAVGKEKPHMYLEIEKEI